MIRLPIMTVSEKCIECGTLVEFDVRAEDYDAWKSGTLIQDALWYISPDLREMLLSKICDKCWQELFAEENE